MSLFNLFKKKEEPKPRFRTIEETIYLAEPQLADKFFKAYKDDLDENDDYHLSAKELKEDYDEERVFKYEPYELPLKLDGNKVYSYIKENEWVQVGRIKKTDIDKLNDSAVLSLYPMEYKYVTEEGIERVKKDPYIAITVTKVITL